MPARSLGRQGPAASSPPAGRAASIGTTHRIVASLAAMTLGLAFLFGVGFAAPDVLHNAAHDARHAGGFPCH